MKHIFRYILIAFLPVIAYAQPAANYYTSAALDGKNGRTLELALTAIISQHTPITYDILWTEFETTDMVPASLLKDPNRTDQVYDMYAWINRLPKYYSDHDHSQQGGINREHCVPNSWWGHEAGNSIAYTDLHHLVPSDGAANSAAKNDNPLGEYAEGMTLGWPTALSTNAQGIIYAYPDNSANHTHSASHKWDIPTEMQSNYGGATAVFEPADEYKGDFARMYLYVVCAYEGTITWQTNYMFTSDADNYTTIQPWAKNLLLKWHRQDPVSDKELARNNAVCNIQGNRNPFIDYPELVEYIWGNMTAETFTLASAISAYDTGNYTCSTSTIGYQNPAETHTATFYSEGAEYVVRNCYEHEEIIFPSPAPTPNDLTYTFVGWSETPVVESTNTRPTLLRHDAMGTSDKVYYAVFAHAAGTETWDEVTTAPAPGTYAILSNSYFLRATTHNNRLANGYFRPVIDEGTHTLSVAPEEDCIWEITKPDGFYRIANGSNYAAATTSEKQGTLSTDASSTYSQWSIGLVSSKMAIMNQGRSGQSDKYLRNNAEHGWATYAENSPAPRLFKKNGNITYTDYTSSTSSQRYSVTIITPQNGSLTVLYNGTPITSGDNFAIGTALTIEATPAPGYRFRNWQKYDGNTYKATYTSTMTYVVENYDVTIKANFEQIPAHDVHWSVDGIINTTPVPEGENIPFSNPANTTIDGKTFVGWSEAPIDGTTDIRPALVTSATMQTTDITYYAVYAEEDTEEVWAEITTAPTDGLYAIVSVSSNYSNFMKAAVSSNRFENGDVAPSISDGKLTTAPAADCIWEISKPDDYYRIKNGTNLAGSSTAKNEGQFYDASTNNNSSHVKWTITYDDVNKRFKVINLARNNASSDPSNKYLRNNSSYGWATYSASTGVNPRLFKKTLHPIYSSYCTTVTVGGSLTLAATDGTYYYATFSTDRATEFTEGTVFTIDVAAGAISLHEVTNNQIPANTGVLIRHNATSVAYNYINNADALSNNMLYPATGALTVAPQEGDYEFFKLAYGNWEQRTELGFYWGADDGAAFAAKAGGAYLAVPQSEVIAPSNGAPVRFLLDFNDPIATDIEHTPSSVLTDGKYVKAIVNGRLVILHGGKIFDIIH